jgi:SHS2 domain-containing protein
VGIWATGPTAGALLEELGLALYGLTTDLRGVRPREVRDVRASADDGPGLVVAFLGQLLLLEEDDGFVGRSIRARVTGDRPRAVVARVRGERFDPTRHVARTEVKAITLHGLVFDPRRGRARVIVDI